MAAQEALSRHRQYSQRNAQHDYLLHGLLRCGPPDCGLVYTGVGSHSGPGRRGEQRPLVYYYVCNGRRKAIQYYGRQGKRCLSRAVNANWLDSQVWAEVDTFVRDPGPLLVKLAARMQGQSDQAEVLRADLAAKQREQDARQQEKDTVLGLFRKGRISERDLDRQLDAIAGEEETCAKAMHALRGQLAALDDVSAALSGAAALLERLRGKVGPEPVSYATRRELVEALVQGVRIGVEENGVSRRGKPLLRAVVRVTYCFQEPSSATPVFAPIAAGDTGCRSRRRPAGRAAPTSGARPSGCAADAPTSGRR